MNHRILIALLTFLCPLSLYAGDAESRIKDLQARVAQQDFKDGKLRQELLAFAREHVGSSHYGAAMTALRAVPSPFDKLDEKAIDDDLRKVLSISGLVAYFRPHDRAVAHVAISQDGLLMATSGWDNVVHLHKFEGKEPKSWAKLDGSPSAVVFSPDSKLLFAGCKDTRVLGWYVTGAAPKEKYALSGHKTRPFVLAVAPKGKMIASGSDQPILRVSNLHEREPETWVELDRDKFPAVGISSLAFSHDGKFLAASHHVGQESLRLWDASGEFLDEKRLPPTTARILACSPTSPIIAFAGEDEEIHLWNFGGEKIEKTHKLTGHAKRGLMPPVKALAFSADGKLLASAGADKWVRIWDVGKGEKTHGWQLEDEPRALAFATDSRHLAVGNSDGTLFVLRMSSLP